MPYTTIVAGTNITSAWANASVRDQVITPFASNAARASAITVPIAGMASALTTNATTEGIEMYNSAGVWNPPWNLPWGLRTSAKVTGAQTFSTGIGVDMIGFTGLTATTRARRYLRITFSVPWYATVAATQFTIQLIDTAGAGTVIGQWSATATAINDNQTITGMQLYTTTTNTHTFKLVAKSSTLNGAATNVAATYPAALTIEDIGPSGAPA